MKSAGDIPKHVDKNPALETSHFVSIESMNTARPYKMDASDGLTRFQHRNVPHGTWANIDGHRYVPHTTMKGISTREKHVRAPDAWSWTTKSKIPHVTQVTTSRHSAKEIPHHAAHEGPHCKASTGTPDCVEHLTQCSAISVIPYCCSGSMLISEDYATMEERT